MSQHFESTLSFSVASNAYFRKRKTLGRYKAGLSYSLRRCLPDSTGVEHVLNRHILAAALVSRVVAIILFKDLAPRVFPKPEQPASLANPHPT